MFDLRHLFNDRNQFASGGLVLMAIGSVGALLRELPGQVARVLLEQVSLEITVKDDDAAFQWVKEWFLEQRFLARVRRVDLDTTLRGTEMALLPAPGNHLFWYRGRPFWIFLHRSEETKGRSQRRTESLTLRTLSRKQQVARDFVDEVVAGHRRKTKAGSSLYVYDDYWARVQAYSARLLDSVILRPGEKERLIADLERFQGARQRYRQLGVPYHRGYLFYGPPGTGKTSLVSAVAAKLGMAIYLINLTEMNDRLLKTAMNEVPENSVILFEDIDCMRAGPRRPEDSAAREEHASQTLTKTADQNMLGVSLSGLLNVLDDFSAPDNVIFVMTTNHVEALDPALLRPGRIDFKLSMGHAVGVQREELYRRFFPQAPVSEAQRFAERHGEATMAELQGVLLRLGEKHAMEEEMFREVVN